MAGGTGGTHATDRHDPGVFRSGIVHPLSESGDRFRGPWNAGAPLEKITGVHGPRCETMLQALEEIRRHRFLEQPDGGVFVWVSLPEELDTQEMFHQAIERKSLTSPGGLFRGWKTRNAIRLNFSNVKRGRSRKAWHGLRR